MFSQFFVSLLECHPAGFPWIGRVYISGEIFFRHAVVGIDPNGGVFKISYMETIADAFLPGMKVLEGQDALILFHKYTAFPVPCGRQSIYRITFVQFGFQSEQQRRALRKFKPIGNGTVWIVARKNKCVIASGNRENGVFYRRIFFLNDAIEAELGESITQQERARKPLGRVVGVEQFSAVELT